MKIFKFAFVSILLNFTTSCHLFAQLRTTVDNGTVTIADNSLFFNPAKYRYYADSLVKLIKARHADTVVLFELALIIDLSNNQLSKPIPSDQSAMADLIIADTLVNRAAQLGVRNIKLQILRAQIYRDLTYRFCGDERWNLSRDEIKRRRNQFNNYKMLANKCYEELTSLDEKNAGDYQKLLVKTTYPIAN